MKKSRNSKKTRSILLISIAIFFGLPFCTIIFGRDMNIEQSYLRLASKEDWVTAFGIANDEALDAATIAVDSNRSIYVAGTVLEDSIENASISIFDENGNKTSEIYWGGPLDDNVKAIYIDSSDNIYITGGTKSFAVTGEDIFVVKYDNNQDLAWNRTYNYGSFDTGMDILADSNGNVYVVADDNGDIYLFKYNRTGDLKWIEQWGGAGQDYVGKMCFDKSGNILIAGSTVSYGSDIMLLCYNSSGAKLWNTTWGCIYGGDVVEDIEIDSDGNIYITGWCKYVPPDMNLYLVKFSSNGIPCWSKVWGEVSDNVLYKDDNGGGIAFDSLGNVYVVGRTRSYSAGLEDIVIFKYSSNGSLEALNYWDHGYIDRGNDIYIDSNDNLFIVGKSNSFSIGNTYNFILIKNPEFPSESTNIPGNSNNQQIPGFDIVIVLGISVVVTLIFYKKKFYKF